jgi:hypothetical protein
VTVCVRRVYRLVCDGVVIGSWTNDEPVSWDADMRRFARNDASWCADNIEDEGTLALAAGASLPAPSKGACLCTLVTLEPETGEPEYCPAE